MDQKPLFSVVMPVYNPGRYLPQAIESILNQTYANFEFIIINDGSTDDSWNIIEKYAAIDSRIKAFNRKNGGVVAAANYAAKKAKGLYLARTDSDDISFPTKLEDFAQVISEQPEVDIVCGSIEVMNERDEFIYRDLVPVYHDDIRRAFYKRNPLPNGATCIKASLFDELGGFSNVFAEDCELWARAWPRARFAGTGTIVYRWRTNPTGLTLSNGDESVKKEKAYLGPLWDIEPPQLVARNELITHASAYLKSGIAYADDYKKVYFDDIARIATNLVKKGHFTQGAGQLLAIMSTGRTGTKVALKRIYLVAKGELNKLRRK